MTPFESTESDTYTTVVYTGYMAKTIWLIRHGESAANAGLATISPASIPLTDNGHKQASHVVATFLAAPDLIITSPYLRAQQTATPTIKRFPAASVEEWSVEEFTYLSLSHLRETTAADRRPFVAEYWDRCDAEYCDGREAESFSVFVDRVRTTIDRFTRSPHQTIAVFSHGQFIRAIMWMLLTGRREIDSTAMKEFEHFLLAVPFPNCAIIRLRVDQERFSIGPVSVDHLD